MNNKKWAIVGAGNGGQAFAAYLSMKGLDISLYDVCQQTIDEINERGGVLIEGNSRETGFGKVSLASTDLRAVVKDAEVVLVILPSIYHSEMAKKLSPYLEDGQTVILNPISPLGPIEFKRILDENGCTSDITLAAAHTLLFACRLKSNGNVYVNGQKEEVCISAFPATANDKVKNLIREYLPEYKFVENILEVSLINLNFEFHPGPTILYASLIEKNIPFEYYCDYVPSQVKLIEAIDKERLQICKAFNIKTVTATEAYHLLYGCEGNDLYKILTEGDFYKGIKGPDSLECRYLTEDVPYSLKPVQVLARIAGIDTPTIDAVINIAYAIMGDKLSEGRTAEKMGFNENTTTEDILKMCC